MRPTRIKGIIMKHKLFLLATLLLISWQVFAASGTCGENLTWDLTNGILTISGTGAMTNWEYDGAPWSSYSGNITSVVIGNGVTSIGDYTFYCCTGLTSATIPNSVTSIGNRAFDSCPRLTSVTIPNNVTSIGSYAFLGCSRLTSITIPNSVTSIGDGLFGSCSGLISVAVEEGNTTYDSRNNCNAIIETSSNTLIASCKNTTIPNSVTSIGNHAFFLCSGLTSVTIPNSVASIGDEAFFGCRGLTSLTIPNSVTSIGFQAFLGCTGLTSVTIPNSVTSIGDGVFSECSGLTSITIPTSVTSIGYGAFSFCSSLTSVTIPNSVTSIRDGAFTGCSGLASIVVKNGNTVYDSRNNCNAIIEIATNTLIAGCKNTVIPNNVISIGVNAFYGCSGLTNITIPTSVTSIGIRALAACTGLTSMTCKAITPPTCGEYLFEDTDKSIPLYVPANSVNAYKAAEVWKDFINIQPIQSSKTDVTIDGTEEQSRKQIRNGVIFIEYNGKIYNISGAEVQ